MVKSFYQHKVERLLVIKAIITQKQRYLIEMHMKTSIFCSILLFCSAPFSVFGQGNQLNNPVQQQVNLYGGTNLENNPESLNKISENNEFAIHEVVQGNSSVNDNVSDQDVFKTNKIGTQNISSAGGGVSFGGGVKLGVNFKRSKLKLDTKIHKLFYRAPKKKRSSTSCFSWS